MEFKEQFIENKKAEYWEKGYVVISNLYSDEQIHSIQSECERLWNIHGLDDDLNLRTEFRRNVNNEYLLDRLDPVIDISPTLSDAVIHRPLISFIEDILGNEAELLKCKLIRKAQNTKGYAAHQDFLYWKWLNISPDSLCSVAISIYDSDEKSGGIGFYPKLHSHLISGPADNPEGDCDVSNFDVSSVEVPLLKAGDVLLFHSLAPHFSGANLSIRPRTILLPSYSVGTNQNLYEKYYMREVLRRCQDFVGFERYFARMSNFQEKLKNR